MAEWITAIAALIAALATVVYLITTILIFHQTKRAADAAKKAADAAEKSADAAQKSVDLAVQQFAEQRGLAPRIVRDLIQEAYLLVGHWLGHAANIAPPPYGNPDPKGLEKHSLLRAADLARTFSDECAQLLTRASATLKIAQGEIEAAQGTARQQTFTNRINPAPARLQATLDLLTKAREIAVQHIPSIETEEPKS